MGYRPPKSFPAQRRGTDQHRKAEQMTLHTFTHISIIISITTWENLISFPTSQCPACSPPHFSPLKKYQYPYEKSQFEALPSNSYLPPHQWNVSSYLQVLRLKALHEDRREIRESQTFSCRQNNTILSQPFIK